MTESDAETKDDGHAEGLLWYPRTRANSMLNVDGRHHLVHEGDWSVVRTEDGELSFIAPDGHASPAAPSRE